MKYYSTIKKNEVVKFSSQRIKLEIIILSEVKVTQTLKTVYVFFYVWMLAFKL